MSTTTIMYIIIILLIIILLLACKQHQHRENFFTGLTEYERYYKYLYGINEGNPVEYQQVKAEYPRGIWRKKDFKDLKWETRLPSLVQQRYSYDDNPYECTNLTPHVPDTAYLKQLPLDLKNIWRAQVNPALAASSLEYEPDVTNPYCVTITDVNKPNLCNCMDKNKCIVTPESDGKRPSCMNFYGSPYSEYTPFDSADSPYSVCGLKYMIQGWNPSDSLPAQKADRSKVSIENKIAAEVQKEREHPNVAGWLPHEK